MHKIRDKLKEADIRLMQLAFYLDMSRPTLYKFLEMYENKQYQDLNKKIFDLFTFIENKRGLTTPVLMNYLINNEVSSKVTMDESNDILSSVRKMSESRADLDKSKVQIITALVNDSKLDFLVEILLDCIKEDGPHTLDNLVSHINNNNKGEVDEEKKPA